MNAKEIVVLEYFDVPIYFLLKFFKRHTENVENLQTTFEFIWLTLHHTTKVTPLKSTNVGFKSHSVFRRKTFNSSWLYKLRNRNSSHQRKTVNSVKQNCTELLIPTLSSVFGLLKYQTQKLSLYIKSMAWIIQNNVTTVPTYFVVVLKK